jgi:hypothetical protein
MNELTKKLIKEGYGDLSKLDTLITDFMKEHDLAIKQAVQTELLKMLPKRIDEYCTDDACNAFNSGFNQAISEVEQVIKGVGGYK